MRVSFLSIYPPFGGFYLSFSGLSAPFGGSSPLLGGLSAPLGSVRANRSGAPASLKRILHRRFDKAVLVELAELPFFIAREYTAP